MGAELTGPAGEYGQAGAKSDRMQAGSWLGTSLRFERNVIITALPLYHIFALTANWLVFTVPGRATRQCSRTSPRSCP